MVAIVAVVAALGLDMTANYMTRTAYKLTNEKLDEIDAAIRTFVKEEQRFPCPADRALTYTDAQFGNERCSAGGGIAAASAGGRNILIGTVPVRQLNLPLRYMADSFERKYLYAVTVGLAQAGTGANQYGGKATGDIYIVGGNRDSVVTPPLSYYHLTETAGTAAYVILSHGKDGRGAFTLKGTSREKDCIPAPTTAHDAKIDVQNCDDDLWFHQANFNTGGVENRFFDDVMRWGMK